MNEAREKKHRWLIKRTLSQKVCSSYMIMKKLNSTLIINSTESAESIITQQYALQILNLLVSLRIISSIIIVQTPLIYKNKTCGSLLSLLHLLRSSCKPGYYCGLLI